MTTVPESPERDAALDAAWRAHSRDEPPARLDDAILAAAHRAVGAGPSDARHIVAEATSPQRWWMPLAAAATIGAIAIGVLQLAPQEPPATAPYVSDMSARDMAPRAKIVTPEKKDAAAAATAPAPSPASPTQMAAANADRPANAGRAGHDTDEAARVPRKQAQPQPFPAEADRRINESGSATSNNAGGVPANDKLEGAPAPDPASALPPHERGTAQTLGKMTPGADAASVSSRADRASAPAAAFAPMPTPAIRSPATPAPSSAPVAGSAPGASSESAPAPLREAAPRDESRQRSAATSPPSDAPLPAGKVATGANVMDAKAPDIDAWIARIHKLFDDGKLPEAAKELTALRAAVPDADRRLPSDLRAWAATVKP